jgi:serine/threonine protein kinase
MSQQAEVVFMPSHVKVVSGPEQGQVFPLAEGANVLLGRSRHTTTRLSDPRVSRVHCEVEVKGNHIFVTDLDSNSGTFVNGERVTEAELNHGDQIQVGDTVLRVEAVRTVMPVTAAPAQPPRARTKVLTAERLHELSGSTLSHYELREVVAKGHSGLVFRAHDFKHERPVAFKVMWPEFSRDEDDKQRFVRAMKTMLPLRHPNLVALFGAGKTGPYCWAAMEFVEGESLTQVIKRIGIAGTLDWQKALRITVYLARALEYAHELHIIHRNITPQNVLVGASPEITKLGDLMLAKAQEGELAQQVTRPGEILGDVRFMSPERTIASPAVDGRSDLYSLGALTYALLTGRPPFEGANLTETITKIRQAEPVRPKKYQLAIPDLVEGLVLGMLAKRPEDRYQTATELLKDLDRVAKLQGVKI